MTDAIQPIPSDEAPARRLDGFAGRLAAVLAIGLSTYALYWVVFVVQPQIYRPSFLLISLVLMTAGAAVRIAGQRRLLS